MALMEITVFCRSMVNVMHFNGVNIVMLWGPCGLTLSQKICSETPRHLLVKISIFDMTKCMRSNMRAAALK